MAATTETQMANNFDHQLRIGSPVKKYMQESYDSPEVMNSAPMRPVSSRPTRTASRASFSEEMPTNTQARRPKTTHVSRYVKFIYSEKATKFCEISTLLLSYVVPVKSKVEISQNFVAFSEYMNFTMI